MCLAAEQHDVGMAAWERRPTLNPQTGLPRSFMELTLDDHLEIWWRAAPLVLPQSRYAALLVSMHGTALYERRDPPRRDVERVRAFLDGQRELQERLLEPARGPAHGASPPTRSCAATSGSSGPGTRCRSGCCSSGQQLGLDPWPFRNHRVSLRCEGRRLAGRFDDEEAMRAALSAAPWVTLELDLAR